MYVYERAYLPVHVGKVPDQTLLGWHLLELDPDNMYPIGQVYVTVSLTAVPSSTRAMPELIPGSLQPPVVHG